MCWGNTVARKRRFQKAKIPEIFDLDTFQFTSQLRLSERGNKKLAKTFLKEKNEKK